MAGGCCFYIYMFNQQNNKIMHVITMTTYSEVKPEIGTDVITGPLEDLNNQMQRLYFNLQQEGWKITNAGYGFIIARHIPTRRIFFAKICYAPQRTIPLAKNKMLKDMFNSKK